MGRPVSPQQLPGSDPAGRHQREAEEQPFPQRLLEGQRTLISSPAQVTSCWSNVHSPVSLSVCQLYLEALPEDKGQWINKTKELRGRYEKIKETVRAPPCGQCSQTNIFPKKFAAAVYYNSCSQVLNKSHSVSVSFPFFFSPPSTT